LGKNKSSPAISFASFVAVGSLISCLVIGVMAYFNEGSDSYHTPLLIVTIMYFVTATYVYLAKSNDSEEVSESVVSSPVSEN
jgi:NCS1 family nucleobase:cation symporter-1